MTSTRISDLIAPCFHAVYRSVRDLTHTHVWLKGGRGSTKSSFASIALVLSVLRGGNAVVIRKYATTLRDSVFAQVLWAIELLGAQADFTASVSPMVIRHVSGRKIVFRGADDPEKLKSVSLTGGDRLLVWIEEAAELTPEEYRSIVQTFVRAVPAVVLVTYNPPRHRGAWVNEEALVARDDRLVHHSTYLDVPKAWLGEQFFAEAQRLLERDEPSYQHEYLGEPTGVGGVVFDNLELRPISEDELAGLGQPYYGLDWGYDPDPTAFVECYYKHGVVYLADEFALQKLGYTQIGELVIERVGRQKMVMCDAADPRGIRDLRDNGINARRAKKFKGSVDYGMRWLRSVERIVIDPVRCPVAAKEFSRYEHVRTKEGYTTAYPDKDNHTIDATRYALSTLMALRPSAR